MTDPSYGAPPVRSGSAGTHESAEPIAAAPASRDVRRVIGKPRPRGLRLWLRRLVLLLASAALVGGLLVWRARRARPAGPEYRTSPVVRGDLRATVTATGTLQARDKVDVGPEISGKISRVLVDFNDRVKKGQVLCEIDPEQLRASRDQAAAQLGAADADLRSGRATAREAQLTVARTQALTARGLSSQKTLEAAEAAAARAEAAVRAGEAKLALASASLRATETSLGKTVIHAPIDGVVLSRAVEPGQAVAASFSTPVLFVLASDLTRMELRVDIDEADIGQVAEGQPATFTVDAFPGRSFPAKLESIHNIAGTVDNVVTYPAVLTVSNPDLTLRPGMTATVTVVTATRKQALLVPNAALRFAPPDELAKSEGGPRPPPILGRREQRQNEGQQDERPKVWRLLGGRPAPVSVTTGLTDGESTEVLAGDLAPGVELLVDVAVRKE